MSDVQINVVKDLLLIDIFVGGLLQMISESPRCILIWIKSVFLKGPAVYSGPKERERDVEPIRAASRLFVPALMVAILCHLGETRR
jgi:hypothetical protein